MKTKANYIEVLRFYPFVVCLALIGLLYSEPKPVYDIKLFFELSIVCTLSIALLTAVLFEKQFCLLNKACAAYDIIAAEYIITRQCLSFPNIDVIVRIIGLAIAAILCLGTFYALLDAYLWKIRKERQRKNRQKFDFERS